MPQSHLPDAPFTRSQVSYKLAAAEGGNGRAQMLVEDAQDLLLASLISRYPGLECTGAPGMNAFYGAGVAVRTASDAAAGFFAVEVMDLGARDHWEAFFLQLPDGSFRTGWGRQCAGDLGEPEDWLEAVAHFRLGEAVQPHAPPEFFALAAAFSNSNGIQYASTDAPERAALAEEAQALRQTAARQAAQLRALRASLGEAAARQGDLVEATAFTRLDQVGDWAAENADRITILPRAIAECRKAHYDNPELVFEALELLAGTYREVRLSQLPRERLMEHAIELGLTIGGSVEPSNAGAGYFFAWRGKRLFLDQHLGRGNSRDPRHCLRIYYTFDEVENVVIVGSMPSHLGNSMS